MAASKIVLDEEAFYSAARQFAELADRMDRFERLIRSNLQAMKAGFNTEAGRKFFASCDDMLLKKIKDESVVINHVKDNLADARREYRSVFDEYDELNRTIRNGY